MVVTESSEQMEINWKKQGDLVATVWMFGIGLLSLVLIAIFSIMDSQTKVPTLAVILGLGFMVLGALFTLTTKYQKTVIQKSGQIFITRTPYFLGKVTTSTHAISDFIAIDYWEYQPGSTAETPRIADISFVDKNNTRVKILSVPLSRALGVKPPDVPPQRIAEQIAQYLNLPLKTPAQGEWRALGS